MRLSKLILHGFKSFADRTEFVFDSPITGIVGPNGCGKSNVVDAFKWVLGEQSAKSLRGDAMMDVIFNGASTRKPSGMSEVTLVFANPLRLDGSRVLALDTDEVSVTRRLYRDGTSEYALNNKSSRLKDIRELFLDTGVGVDAYSVIEQGRVAQLLDANPQERRLIFEEAAGISKFKARKKEAQRKLEKVDQNLLRVTDIVDEVERRLRGVRVQAGRARVYQEHATRLSELRLDFALREYHTFRNELTDVESRLEDARFRLEDAGANLTSAQGELTEKREAESNASAAKQQAEYQLVELRSQIDRARQAEEFAARQIAQVGEQLRALEQEGLASAERLETARTSLEQEKTRLAELTATVNERNAEINRLAEAFKQGQLKVHSLHQEGERHKAAVLDAMRRHAQTSSRLGAIEIERKNAGANQQRLATRRQQVVADTETAEAKKIDLETKVKEAADEVTARQADAETVKVEAQQLSQQLRTLTEHLSSAKENRSALQGRQRVLQDLEQKQQGVTEGVKSVLRRKQKDFPFIRGLVVDHLRVDIEHARMVEAALDGRDQWLVVSSIADVLPTADLLAKLEGRVNFVSMEPMQVSAFDRATQAMTGSVTAETTAIAVANHASASATPPNALPNAPANAPAGAPADSIVITDTQTGSPSPAELAAPAAGGVNPLDAFYIRHPSSDINHYAEELANSPVPVRLAIDLVRFEPEAGPIARRLLSRIAIVDSLADAEQLRLQGPTGWKYVTKAGECLDTDGTLHVGPPSAAMGLISRRAELEQLADALAEAEEKIAALTAELAGGNEQAKALEARQSDLRTAIYQANTRRVEANSTLQQVVHAINTLKREQPVLDRELEILLDQQGKLTTEEQTLQTRKAEIEQQQAAAQKGAEDAAAAHKALEADLKTEGDALAHARVAIAEFQQKQIASRQHEGRLSAQVNELQQQIARITQQSGQFIERRGAAEAELEQARLRQQQLTAQRETLRQHAEELAERLTGLTAAVAELADSVETARTAHADIERELSDLAVRESGLKVRLETVISRTQQDLQLDLPAKYAELPDYQPAERDWEAVADEIGSLRDKINRLGNVNLDSISEMDELEQRSTFLAKELTDLRDSKLQLEALIEEINAESSIRFQKTFELVRDHFQGMFRKLFGGGKADLYLETELEPKQQTITVTHPDGSVTTEPAPMIKVDPLDAGIEVIARPPGKQPVSISQLSGGEKTMTCVALLLSIFKSKPSPFCILDEVDAALDEANNSRFNLIVQEFTDHSQFIVITHSKRTMTIADQLYGITQQEQGVSRRVAVKFDQVGKDGTIDKSAVKEADKQEPALEPAGT